MNPKVIRGGCLCGKIRYEATGQPYDVTHCHCSDCRRSSGAPFVTWASFRRETFKFVSEHPGEVQWAGRLRSFCQHCGTSLTYLAGPDVDEIAVTISSLDHPETVTPADHTWVQDQLPWIRIADGLPRFAQNREPQGSR